MLNSIAVSVTQTIKQNIKNGEVCLFVFFLFVVFCLFVLFVCVCFFIFHWSKRVLEWWPRLVEANLVCDALLPDGRKACIRGLVAIGCKKQKIGFCGAPWGRSMSSNRLQWAYNDDDVAVCSWVTALDSIVQDLQ